MKVRALGAFLFAFALLGSAGPQPNDLVARGKNGVVVTQDPHATQVGLDVLASGGNAIDAAVAVALTLSVTHPQAGNLGGGGFLVYRKLDGTVATIDFRERAPKSATRDMYLKPDGSVDNDKVQLGVTAAGVPGSPAGMLHALQKFGSKNLAELAAPAIRLAREGFTVDQHLAGSLRAKRRQLSRRPARSSSRTARRSRRATCWCRPTSPTRSSGSPKAATRASTTARPPGASPRTWSATAASSRSTT